MNSKTKINQNGSLLILFVIGIFLLSSCNRYALFTHNEPPQQGPGSGKGSDDGTESMEKILMPDDKIAISIWNHEDLSVGSVHNIYNVQEETGKWLMIDSKGEVNLPQIGIVKLEGMTIREAKIALEKAYGKYVQNPIINIRLFNNQATVLGEIRVPGVYMFSADHIRLTDLIGKASGFTDYAKTKQIKVVRGKEVIKIDLTNLAFNETQLYPGDVVYVPPSGNKTIDRIAAKMLPLAGLLTAIALVYNVSQN